MEEEYFAEEDRELTRERFALMVERLSRIATEETIEEPYQDYFAAEAVRLLRATEIYEKVKAGTLAERTMEECEADEEALWGHLDPAKYETSWANPVYAVCQAGQEAGQILSFLCSEMDNVTAYAFQGRLEELTIFLELFVEVYGCFAEEEFSGAREAIHSFFHDYCDLFVENQLRGQLCPDDNFFVDLVMHADLSDLRYLYRYGLPIGENELRVAAFLNGLSEEEIQTMADTYTEGLRLGFVAMSRDLSKKHLVQMNVPVGFERVTRAAVKNFEKLGLSPTMVREPSSSAQGKGLTKRAVYSTSVNRQYDFDHREDMALYLDKAYVERRLESLREAFTQLREQALLYAGPAWIDVFGEAPFSPETHAEALHLTEEQQQLNVTQSTESGLITYSYVPSDETAFTIIGFPMPEIGERFEEIFAETVKINTLDYTTYQRMQQCLIDVLDGAKEVHIAGQGENHTDLTVAIHPLEDPAHETAFENCVADVNIPVGEVFTSPVLTGTNGVLHVTHVFLNGLQYRDLSVTFCDGKIADYSCANFDSEEENRAYVKANLMNHHDTLALGEFSIGTNTTAYVMAKKYDIEDRMPILIAEKTGPHFAVGDTCYSHEEDAVTKNPDGKRIVAKENEVSALRTSDPANAYYSWHLDITIPYEELGAITAIYPDGSTVDIIRDGLFRVAGAEELNAPLLEEQKA